MNHEANGSHNQSLGILVQRRVGGFVSPLRSCATSSVNLRFFFLKGKSRMGDNYSPCLYGGSCYGVCHGLGRCLPWGPDLLQVGAWAPGRRAKATSLWRPLSLAAGRRLSEWTQLLTWVPAVPAGHAERSQGWRDPGEGKEKDAKAITATRPCCYHSPWKPQPRRGLNHDPISQAHRERHPTEAVGPRAVVPPFQAPWSRASPRMLRILERVGAWALLGAPPRSQHRL